MGVNGVTEKVYAAQYKHFISLDGASFTVNLYEPVRDALEIYLYCTFTYYT